MADQTSSLQIRLIGGSSVLRDGNVLLDARWSRRKARALLQLVAVQPGGQLHRDQVCEALWPDLSPRAATNNLHYLRTALGHGESGADGDLLALSGDVVRLADHVRVDLRDCLTEMTAARGSGDLDACDRALARAEHELLPEDAYEDWVASARDQLASATTELLREAIALHIRGRRWDAAIDRTRELLDVEPTDEDAHRALMQVYVQAGSRHRALRQFEICREALQAELGVEPSPQTLALHAKLLEEALPEMPLQVMGAELPPTAQHAPIARPLSY